MLYLLPPVKGCDFENIRKMIILGGKKIIIMALDSMQMKVSNLLYSSLCLPCNYLWEDIGVTVKILNIGTYMSEQTV